MNSLILSNDERLFNRLLLLSVVYSIVVSISASQNLTISFPHHKASVPQTGYIKAASAADTDLSQSFTEEKLSYIPPSTIEIANEKQLWEKEIQKRFSGKKILNVADGVKHITFIRYTNTGPAAVHIIEINRRVNDKLEIKPVLASDQLMRKATVGNIARKANAIAAVNGTFFKPDNGVPIGTLFIDKKIYTGPIYNRVALGIGKNEFMMNRLEIQANLVTDSKLIKIDNFNQPRMLSSYVLAYNSTWGSYSPATPKYGVQVVIKDNKVVKLTQEQNQIPKDGYVLVGPAQKLGQLKPEQVVNIDIKMLPDWGTVDHIVSGGPYLVKEGKIFIDSKEQRFVSIEGRNPRTAVGYTQDGRFIMVTVDGREESSVGMTLNELAGLMREIGCYNAMNFDGGGSTQMFVNGKMANLPSGGARPVSNALTIYQVK